MSYLPDGQRNLVVLTLAQTLGAASPAVVVSMGGLVGQILSPNLAFATLPVTGYAVGLAIGTIPLGMLLQRLGRRGTYPIAALAGIAAGLVAFLGIAIENFAVFCLGTFLAGIYAAAVQSYRFAAMETVTPDRRARALQWVLIGGLVAAVLGPQATIVSRDMVDGVPYGGAFLAQALMAMLALGVLLLMRGTRPVVRRKGAGRPLMEIARLPKFRVALVTSIAAYSMMNFMMTAGPLAMVMCGFSPTEAALGIQWHILGMYGPSLVTGRLIERFGDGKVMIAGLLIMGAGALAGLAGLGLAEFWIALTLLGVGWNFAFFGATSMLATCHTPEEGPKVQSLHDFVMFAMVAVGSVCSGVVLGVFGWSGVNYVVLPVVLGAATLVLLSPRLDPKPA